MRASSLSAFVPQSMPFNSFSYPAFLAATVALFWILPVKLRTYFLIAVGVLFYVSHTPSSFVVIALLSLFTFVIGQTLLRTPDRRVMRTVLAIAFIVLVFALFKYEAMIAHSVNAVFGTTYSPLKIAMPLGISFFVFEFIHYVIEIHRGHITRHSMKDFAAFALFFPTMVSGPIKRFEQFRESLSTLGWKPEYAYRGVQLIVLGYAQKYVFADPLIPFTQHLAHPEVLDSMTSALGGLFFYAFRIYFDFAGLSNIAIGSALLFGILVPKNFNNPYARPNIQLFWNNWHMSLSSWVRDYVYITLGGNRRGEVFTLLNLTISMMIVGLWHGASWNFVVWGLYHGVGLSVHRLWKKAGLSLGSSFIGRIIGVVLTFLFVMVGWAFFVTDSLSDSILLLQKAFPFLL